MLCFKRLYLLIILLSSEAKTPTVVLPHTYVGFFTLQQSAFIEIVTAEMLPLRCFFIKNVQELQPQVWKITLQSLGAKKRLCVLALVCDLSCHSGFIGPKCEMKEYNVLYVVPGSGKLRYVLIASIIGALQVAIISVVVLCITRWVITWKEVCICDFLVGFIGPKITFSIIFALTYKKNRDKLF